MKKHINPYFLKDKIMINKKIIFLFLSLFIATQTVASVDSNNKEEIRQVLKQTGKMFKEFYTLILISGLSDEAKAKILTAGTLGFCGFALIAIALIVYNDSKDSDSSFSSSGSYFNYSSNSRKWEYPSSYKRYSFEKKKPKKKKKFFVSEPKVKRKFTTTIFETEIKEEKPLEKESSYSQYDQSNPQYRQTSEQNIYPSAPTFFDDGGAPSGGPEIPQYVID
ncbi:hypothetical protein ACFLYA_02035 [Candidatus Dependentiae bacterium]